MIRFFVVVRANGFQTTGFDSIEEANEVAERQISRGFPAYVDARESPPETVAQVLEQPQCRKIRWAGVAP